MVRAHLQQPVSQELDHCPGFGQVYPRAGGDYDCCVLPRLLWHLQAQVVVFAARVLEVRHVYRAHDDLGCDGIDRRSWLAFASWQRAAWQKSGSSEGQSAQRYPVVEEAHYSPAGDWAQSIWEKLRVKIFDLEIDLYGQTAKRIHVVAHMDCLLVSTRNTLRSANTSSLAPTIPCLR